MGHSYSELKFDLDKIRTLNKDDLKYLELLGKGAFGVVQKAYDIRSCTFLALKYCQSKPNQSFQSVWKEIGPEDHILSKIEEIKNPTFLKYNGIMKDPLNEKNLVLVMESGEATIGDLLKAGIYLSVEETLFIFKQLVNQFELLQQHGIANRDVKPANIIIVRNAKEEYCVKIADFGIGCHIIESGKNNISIDDFKGCTIRFSAPEVLEIEDDCYEKNNYDPFKGDVFSLGITLKDMLLPGTVVKEIDELIDVMAKENPEERISFIDLKNLLEEERYKKLMISSIKMKKYLDICKKKKDEQKSLKEKINEYMKSFKLYDEICHYEQAGEYAAKLDQILHENVSESTIKDEDQLIGTFYNQLALFFETVKLDFKKAKNYYEKGLELRLKAFGEMHAETAKSYNYLAMFYCNTSNIMQNSQLSEVYHKKALEIRIQLFGEFDGQTAQSYNNLAIFYETMKQDFLLAEEYYEKALKIRLQVHGEMHTYTSESYNNLAVFNVCSKKDYQKAEIYYEKALQIKMHLHGEMHVSTAQSLFNFGFFIKNKKKDKKKGNELMRKSYEISKKILGEKHEFTKKVLSQLSDDDCRIY